MTSDAVKMAIEALRPFKLLAELARGSEPGASEMINVNIIRKCADALAALEQAGEPEPPLTTLQRLGQEFDGEGEAKAKGMDEGADFCIQTLAKALGVEDWDQADGSETWDGDVAGTIYNVLKAGRVYDDEDGRVARLEDAAQSRGQAFDGEGEELAEAVRSIMARCEALEDEASNGIAMTSANVRDDTHEAGFWRGQKSTAKSIREHLHDMTRAALSSAKRGE